VIEPCSRFKGIPYKQLNARQKELFNFQKLAATFADRGFNCIKLADDWQGADFIAYHAIEAFTLKVQLKSRLTIDSKKYGGKDIWMAFPHGKSHDKCWYLIQHDSLVEKIGKSTKWLNSDSWKKKGAYSSTGINPTLLASLAEDRLGPVYGTILDS
jgi:hypothetical protein